MTEHKHERFIRQNDLVLSAVAFVIALVLWQVQGLFFLTYPLRLFVTMIHELGHGTAAGLTGGDFLEFRVMSRGAGVAYTRGGIREIIIPAGYLGTALFGAVLLLLTHRTPYLRQVAVGVGLLIGTLSLLYSGINLANLGALELLLAGGVMAVGAALYLMRDADEGRHRQGLAVAGAGGVLGLLFATGSNTLTVLVGLGAAVLLVLAGWRANRDILLVILTFLALITGLQAITDAWILFKIVSLPNSMMPMNDASSMAREVGGPAGFWALVWIALDIVIFGVAVYVALVQPYRRRAEAQNLPADRL